ncbi:MAG: hypothetical protein ACI4QR_07105 [Eubacteriales bacterium]
MQQIKKIINDFPWWLTLILVILVDGLVGGLYRIAGKKTSSKVVGAVLLVSFIVSVVSFIGLPAILGWIVRVIYIICWIADIITVVLAHKITLFAD